MRLFDLDAAKRGEKVCLRDGMLCWLSSNSFGGSIASRKDGLFLHRVVP